MYIRVYKITNEMGSLLRGVHIFNKIKHKRNCKCSNK